MIKHKGHSFICKVPNFRGFEYYFLYRYYNCSICGKEAIVNKLNEWYYLKHFMNIYSVPLLIKLELTCEEEQVKKILE